MSRQEAVRLRVVATGDALAAKLAEAVVAEMVA